MTAQPAATAAATAAAAGRRSHPAPALRRSHTEAAESSRSAAIASSPAASTASATDSLISCVQCGAVGPLEYESSIGAYICLQCGHAETRAATTMLAAALLRARSTPSSFAPASSAAAASSSSSSLLFRLSESLTSGAGGSAGLESMYDGWAGGSDSSFRRGGGAGSSSAGRSSLPAAAAGFSFVSKESTRTALSKSASSGGFALAASGMIADSSSTDATVREREGRRRQARRARELMDKLRMPPRWAPQLFALLEQAARGVVLPPQTEDEELEDETTAVTSEEHAAKRARAAAAPALSLASTAAAAASAAAPPSVPLRFSHGHLGDLVIGSCCLQLCRLHSRACSMLDVSDALGINVFRFGAAFSRVCAALRWDSPRLDAAVFVERIIASVAEAQNQTAGAQAHAQPAGPAAGKRKRGAAADSAPLLLDASPLSAVRLAIRRDAHALLRLASRSSLDCGRHPLSLAGGAVHLALQCHSVPSSLDALSVACKISSRTIQARAKEIQQAVAALAAEHMPALAFKEPGQPSSARKTQQRLSQPNFALIVEHVDTILAIIEASENAQVEASAAAAAATAASVIDAESMQASDHDAPPADPSVTQSASAPSSSLAAPPASILLARAPVASDPPAFQHAHAQRLDRFQRLQRAAHRLQSPASSASAAAAASSASSGADLNDEDRLLERLLSRGVPLVRLLDDSLQRLSEAEAESAGPAAYAADPSAFDRALSDADLSEAELALHLRSPSELAQWRRLDAATQQQLG